MSIHLAHRQGQLNAVFLDHIHHHRAFAHLSTLLREHKPDQGFNQIDTIQIKNSKLNDFDYQSLQSIFRECDHLQHIKLQGNDMDCIHAYQLLAELSDKKLCTLTFTDNWIGQALCEGFFDFMQQQKQLESINLSLNWLGDEGIIELLKALNPNTHRLNLSCNDFYKNGLEAICHYLLCKDHVEEIDISYNNLDEGSAEKIAVVLKENHSLHKIRINSNHLNSRGCGLIAESLQYNQGLASLDISDNSLSTRDAKNLIQSACASPTLKQLNLRSNGLIRGNLGRWPGHLQVFI